MSVSNAEQPPYTEAEVLAAQQRAEQHQAQAQVGYLQNRVLELEVLLERSSIEKEALRARLAAVEQAQFDAAISAQSASDDEDVAVITDVGPEQPR
jgi:hypothetical protein